MLIDNELDLVRKNIEESIRVKSALLGDADAIECIQRMADMVADSILMGGKLLVCGNGGSASDSLHMVGEIVGRFQRERSGLPAICLNADVATMTAISNDYGYDEVFARAVEAYMAQGDVLLGISTSGNSENVLRAVRRAKEEGGTALALVGKGGGKIAAEADECLVVPSNCTARIQESHIMAIHIICEIVENRYVSNSC